MVDRVYERNAAQSAPQPPADPSVGYPTSGNPAQGVPATIPGDYWYHMITESLRKVIVDAGLTPDHEDLGQLLAAIRGLGATTTQKGTVEKATLTEAKSGAADKFPDSAGLKAALDDRFSLTTHKLVSVSGVLAMEEI